MLLQLTWAALTAIMPQTPAASQATPGVEAAAQLVLPGATLSPDCGGLYGLAGRAFCVTAPLGTIDALSETYVKDLGDRGWLAADGARNRVIFVRRRDGGGCDGVQMLAFYDLSKPATDDSPGYLAFAAIPGDVCAPVEEAQAATPSGPATPPQ